MHAVRRLRARQTPEAAARARRLWSVVRDAFLSQAGLKAVDAFLALGQARFFRFLLCVCMRCYIWPVCARHRSAVRRWRRLQRVGLASTTRRRRSRAKATWPTTPWYVCVSFMYTLVPYRRCVRAGRADCAAQTGPPAHHHKVPAHGAVPSLLPHTLTYTYVCHAREGHPPRIPLPCSTGPSSLALRHRMEPLACRSTCGTSPRALRCSCPPNTCL